MGELMQNPLPAEHGRFLQKETVSGSRVQFVETSTVAGGGLLLSASGAANNFDFGTFTISLDHVEDGNVVPWENVVGWNFCNFYIDSAGSGSAFSDNFYRYGSNVSGTSAALRKPMSIDIYAHDLAVPGLTFFDNSQVRIWYVKNNDSSVHTLDVISQWRYLLTGDPNA